MLHNLFKRRFDFALAIREICLACRHCEKYDSILPSVHFSENSQAFEVTFKCAVKEYRKKDAYFFALRHREKFTDADLEVLMKCVITYLKSPNAFVNPPAEGSLPEGVKFSAKDYTRIPYTRSFLYGL